MTKNNNHFIYGDYDKAMAAYIIANGAAAYDLVVTGGMLGWAGEIK